MLEWLYFLKHFHFPSFQSNSHKEPHRLERIEIYRSIMKKLAFNLAQDDENQFLK